MKIRAVSGREIDAPHPRLLRRCVGKMPENIAGVITKLGGDEQEKFGTIPGSGDLYRPARTEWWMASIGHQRGWTVIDVGEARKIAAQTGDGALAVGLEIYATFDKGRNWDNLDDPDGDDENPRRDGCFGLSYDEFCLATKGAEYITRQVDIATAELIRPEPRKPETVCENSFFKYIDRGEDMDAFIDSKLRAAEALMRLRRARIWLTCHQIEWLKRPQKD